MTSAAHKMDESPPLYELCPFGCDRCRAKVRFVEMALDSERGAGLLDLATKYQKVYQVAWRSLQKGKALLKELRRRGLV